MPLITPFEVVTYCKDVKKEFPQSFFDIEVEELNVFFECLGEDFYPILTDDLVDYSAATEWIEGNTYNVGDQVIFEGCVFQSTTATNTLFPTNTAGWTEADKFQTAEYNTLWTTGQLRSFLAYTVVHSALVASTWSPGATGVVERFEERITIKTSDRGIFRLVSQQFNEGIAKRWRILKKYILDKYDDSTTQSLYTEVGFIKDCPGACDTSDIRQRGIFYRY